jgi:hypothetical protein
MWANQGKSLTFRLRFSKVEESRDHQDGTRKRDPIDEAVLSNKKKVP